MYGVKVIFILYLVSDYIGVKRFWERWVRVKQRTRQASPRTEERKRLGSTLVEALAASLEQHSPPNQYRCSCSNPDNKLCFHSPTRGVSEDSKQQPGKGRQVLRSQLCKPGEADKIPKREMFPGSRSWTRCQLRGRRRCGLERSRNWGGTRSWFLIGMKTINFAK